MATPVLGNLILIISSAQLISTIGYYIYFIGMDVAVYSLWYFTHIYCDIGKPKKTLQIPILIFFALDMILYTLNPFFNCSFSTEPIMVEERAYFRLVPYLGQTYHRVICYGLFFVILIIFAVKTIKATKVYKEKVIDLRDRRINLKDRMEFSALDGVDLTLESGHIYGLVGNNGAGKTTLMRLIAGLVMPTSGSLSLFGAESEKELFAARQRLGSLISQPAGYEDLTLWQNLVSLM